MSPRKSFIFDRYDSHSLLRVLRSVTLRAQCRVLTRNLLLKEARRRMQRYRWPRQRGRTSWWCTGSRRYLASSLGRSGRRCRTGMPAQQTDKLASIFGKRRISAARMEGGEITIIAMPAHCIKPANSRRPLTTVQPCSLFCFPPTRTTMKAMRVMPSMTTAKDIKKPTDRHMEQK